MILNFLWHICYRNNVAYKNKMNICRRASADVGYNKIIDLNVTFQIGGSYYQILLSQFVNDFEKKIDKWQKK